MAYDFKYLKPEDVTKIKDEIAAKDEPKPVKAPDEGLQRAWEADLAAHQALLAAATTDPEQQAVHQDAIHALESALLNGQSAGAVEDVAAAEEAVVEAEAAAEEAAAAAEAATPGSPEAEALAKEAEKAALEAAAKAAAAEAAAAKAAEAEAAAAAKEAEVAAAEALKVK